MTVNTAPYEQARFAKTHTQQQEAHKTRPYRDVGQPRRPKFKCRALQLTPRFDLVKPGRPVSCDVEGVTLPRKVGIEQKGCGRVSIVNEDGELILDTFAYYPAEEEARPPPAWLRLGVYRSDLEQRNGAQPVEVVLEYVKDIFNISGIIVGHAIINEITMLRELPWSQWQTRDTQKALWYMRYARNPAQGPSLRDLSHQVLGESIQEKEHDSVEDAKATMKLYLLQKASIEREQSPQHADSLSDSSAGSTTSHRDSSQSVFTASTLEISSLDSSTSVGIDTPLAPGHLVALPNILALAKGRQFDKRNSRYLHTWKHQAALHACEKIWSRQGPFSFGQSMHVLSNLHDLQEQPPETASEHEQHLLAFTPSQSRPRKPHRVLMQQPMHRPTLGQRQITKATIQYAKKDSVASLDVTPPLPKLKGIDPDHLFQQARWIRDTLDPQVAQEGQDALHSDEVLTLDELLRNILDSELSLEDIRYSRMHLAICDVSGRATRWPKRLIDRCDAIKDMWEGKYGPLQNLGTPLYEPGGRLHGICKPEDLSMEKLLVKWLKSPDVKLSPAVARRTGGLGFTPGDWWISTVFAYRAGIIDSGNPEGGIVSNADGAYAVVMTDDDEIPGSDPERFWYRARENDPGRYRLTAATPESRQPIRILRGHSLHSFWKPKAGLRYDGLYKVIGWTWRKDTKSSETICAVHFKRLATEPKMDSVLCRPWTDEAEDYAEYKRLRHMQREKQQQLQLQQDTSKPKFTVSADGAMEIFEDETAQAPFQEQFSDRMPEQDDKQRSKFALLEVTGNVRGI